MSLRGRREDGGRQLAELAALADGSIPGERRAALEASVAASPELADRLAEQRAAVALVRSAVVAVGTPDTLRSSVAAQRRARRRSPVRGRALIGAAATAALAVAVGVSVIGSRTSPERYHVALGPTGLAPRAAGEATLTRTPSGWRIELDAESLPRLDGRRYYEAWLRNAAGVLVPVGTFNQTGTSRCGRASRRRTTPTLTITRELADGDQASSGESMLVGTVESSD